jgi:hypothetical protein
LRDDIEQGNEEGLKDRLEAARDGRETWMKERASADWAEMKHGPDQYPSWNERFFGSLISRKPKRNQ